MKIYNVYSNPQGNYKAVKKGWSWPASIFTSLWAFFNKIWALGFGFWVILSMSYYFLSIELSLFLVVATIFIFGVNGNKWLEKQAISSGFEFKDTLTADNTEGAIAQYVKDSSDNTKRVVIISKVCESCGANLIYGSKFCDKCGTKVTNICSNCGVLLDKEDMFCNKCGHPTGKNITVPVDKDRINNGVLVSS